MTKTIMWEKLSLTSAEVKKIRTALGVKENEWDNRVVSKYNNWIVWFEFDKFVVSKEARWEWFLFNIARVWGGMFKEFNSLADLLKNMKDNLETNK